MQISLPGTTQSRTQSNACSRVRLALALGKRNDLRTISYASLNAHARTDCIIITRNSYSKFVKLTASF